MEDIEVRVKKVVALKLGREIEAIELHHTFQADLRADSLDAVELMMAFEDEFEIEIPDATAQSLLSVQAVVDYLNGAAVVK